MGRYLLLALTWFLPMLSTAQTPTPSRPAITGISHVTFYADDMAKSAKFYTATMGWDQVPAAGARSGVRFYANHAQYVELETPPKPGMEDRLALVAFATSDADGLRRYMGSHGVSVPAAVTAAADGSRSFITHDPEGNTVAFTQQTGHSVPRPASASRSLSSHIMHAGYVAHNRAALDHFYKDVLGFHLYWQGGAKPGHTDWVMMQVPNGTDWLEYMLYLPAHASRAEQGSANHIAPGVVSVVDLQKRLEQRGWTAPDTKDPKVLGVDGKWQLDLHDPDGTRVEFMEFKPAKTPCCSAYTAPQPEPSTAW